jgi:anti-sigma regulatory factor (Ser/Thr protein kinase)
MDEMSFVDLCLLVTELIVEALGSDGGNRAQPIELSAELQGDRVRVTISDGAGAYHLPSRRPEPGEPGWGLVLVQRLSNRWGMRRQRDGAVVWLELLRNSSASVA